MTDTNEHLVSPLSMQIDPEDIRSSYKKSTPRKNHNKFFLPYCFFCFLLIIVIQTIYFHRKITSTNKKIEDSLYKIELAEQKINSISHKMLKTKTSINRSGTSFHKVAIQLQNNVENIRKISVSNTKKLTLLESNKKKQLSQIEKMKASIVQNSNTQKKSEHKVASMTNKLNALSNLLIHHISQIDNTLKNAQIDSILDKSNRLNNRLDKLESEQHSTNLYRQQMTRQILTLQQQIQAKYSVPK